MKARRALWSIALAALLGGGARAAEPVGVIAVVVAKEQRGGVGLEELALIYRRKKLVWDDGSRIHPVNLPAAHPLRRQFSVAVLGAGVEALESYWNDQYFHGIAPPFVLASDEAVLRFVEQTPGAIGYLGYCAVAGRARIVLALDEHGVVAEERAAAACSRRGEPGSTAH